VSTAGGYGAAISAAGYGTEALAAIAQSIQAGKRARAIASYNEDVTNANAQAQAYAAENEAIQYQRQAAIAQQDQVLAGQAQSYRERREREQHERILGQTRAIIASSGLMMGGSPLAAYEETARQQELDVLAQRYQTALQIRASGEQATQAEYAAQMARWGAGERLRVGRAQGGLLKAQADDDYVLAGLMKAGGAAVKGAGTYAYLSERQKSPLSPTEQSLLTG
jgi:hypothetical protein